MATITLFVEHTASANIYFRVFNSSGQVLDFTDNTFKALSGATTPYVEADERADMAGTGRSGYTADINLANVNNSAAAQFVVKAYDNETPADTDNPIAPASTNETILPAPHFWVEFGEYGRGEILVQAEINVKSTAGSTAQVAVWLERNGVKLDIDTIDASCTASVTLREHGSASNLFTLNFTNSDIQGDRFEKEQSSPAFTDDRQYEMACSITENSNTHSTSHGTVVIG